jgi:hypothetical protein
MHSRVTLSANACTISTAHILTIVVMNHHGTVLLTQTMAVSVRLKEVAIRLERQIAVTYTLIPCNVNAMLSLHSTQYFPMGAAAVMSMLKNSMSPVSATVQESLSQDMIKAAANCLHITKLKIASVISYKHQPMNLTVMVTIAVVIQDSILCNLASVQITILGQKLCAAISLRSAQIPDAHILQLIVTNYIY